MEILDNFFGLPKKIKIIYALNLILGICVLCIQIFFEIYYSIPLIFMIINFFIILVYLFNIFYNLYQIIKFNNLNKNLKKYNDNLTNLYDNVRGFKHDFDNMVNIISGYIQLNDMEGLKKYFSSLEDDCITTNNLQILNPKIINNPGIYNLIATKYKEACKLNIKFNIEVLFDFNKLKIPIYEFSKILGILLDNSIEASKDCEEKQINLIFRENKKFNIKIIIIENTYSNKNLDTLKIFNKGFSEKANHTGIGLWEVNQIVKKYDNLILNTTKDEKYFKQELQIQF